jgi:capsular polysaccharide export protein
MFDIYRLEAETSEFDSRRRDAASQRRLPPGSGGPYRQEAMRRSPLPDPAEPPSRRGAPLGAAAGVFSRNSLAFPHLEALLGVRAIVGFPRRGDAAGLDFVVGWGDKPSAGRPRAYGLRHGVPFLAAEDGFLRSAGSHRIKPPPISLVLDDEGIYYRAATPSRLERLIAAAPGFDAVRRAMAERALVRVRDEKLTKYNTVGPPVAADGRRIGVLLVDQVFADQSIAGGLASAASFAAMVEAALAALPAADVAVKVHPDVLAGRATGYLLAHARRHGLDLIADAGNPFDLLSRVDRVFTVTSQLGFEALVAGLPVRCFGVPFYAGWGLTEDTPTEGAAAAALARRGVPRDLLDLFAAAYVAYPRYADPVRREAIDVEQAIDRLLEWREAFARRDRAVTLVGGPLDARLAEAVLGGGGGAVTLLPGTADGTLRSVTAAGSSSPATAATVLRWRTGGREGDGAGIVRPGLVRDDRLGRARGFDGSLYADADGDPFRPDGPLAALLATAEPEPVERARAGAVLSALARTAFARIDLVAEREVAPAAGGKDAPVAAVILAAPGEGIAALREAAGPGEAAIVDAARAERPHARIVVLRERPRPIGQQRWPALRRTLLPPHRSARPPPRTMPAALARAVAVHTDAAVSALDALALGLPVTVHGRPLYAGWGFTTDRDPPERPRALSLEDFVALAVVLGAQWADPVSGLPATAEEVVHLFAAEPVDRPDAGVLVRLDRLEKRLKRVLRV